MKFSYRLLALWLIVVLIVPACLTAAVANRSISSVYGPLPLVDAILDSTNPILPKRPFTIEEQLYSEMDPLKRYLVSRNISCKTLLRDEALKERIMNAASIEELVSTKLELEALKRLMDEADALLDKESPPIGAGMGLGVDMSELSAFALKLNELFKANLTIYQPEPDSAMKGTWTPENKILLKWTPVDGWIPEEGYDLFRVINGNAELVSPGLGSLDATVQQLSGNPEYADYVEILRAATLDDEKKAILSVASEAEFHAQAYANAHTYESYTRLSGYSGFLLRRDLLLAIPGGIAQKIPFADSYANTDVHFKEDIQAETTSYEAFAANQGLQPVNPVLPSYMPPILSKAEQVRNEMLEARKAILTKAFVDHRFADDIGLGYEDIFGETRYDVNTPVQYILVPRGGSGSEVDVTRIASGEEIAGAYRITVPYGVEMPLSPPDRILGYGADQNVSLRWDAPTDDAQKEIISGYYVERRKKGQTQYEPANPLPVAITYSQEIEGFLCEAPVTFEDVNVGLGDEFIYRIQAVDIFGRRSAYSSELEVKVYKVTPPESPLLLEPTVSTRVNGRTPETHQQLFTLNNHTGGVVLPISANSPDTALFVIYRSKAYGRSHFGVPEELARINYAPYQGLNQPVYAYNPTGSLFSIRTTQADVLYYDSDVEPGYYYKYWVSAVDVYGNESEWSPSVIAAMSSDAVAQIPLQPVAEMHHNQVVADREPNPPGFHSRYLTKDETQTVMGLDTSIQFDPSGTESVSASEPGLSQQTSELIPEKDPEIGVSLSNTIRQDSPSLPGRLSLEDDNLPYPNDVLNIIALTDNDVEADGTAQFNWYHYQGDGLKGYAVYRAYADGVTRESLEHMSQAEILESFDWRLRTNSTTVNEATDRVERRSGRIYLYLICLIPDRPSTRFLEAMDTYIPAGWVRVSWDRPDDPQLSYFRVYRAEVAGFDDAQDPSTLNWQLVSDNTKTTVYSEKVDQTDAHYYLYKITSVSIWGVESDEGAIVRYRVPATVAPEAPTLLVPFSRKGVNQINWLGVAHATRYIIYRAKIPRMDAEDFNRLRDQYPNLYGKMFGADKYRDIYRPDEEIIRQQQSQISGSGMLPDMPVLASVQGFAPTAGGVNQSTDALPSMVSRFKTGETDGLAFSNRLSEGIDIEDKTRVIQDMIEKYGLLAVAPYSSLGRDLAETVVWEEVGEVRIAPGEDPTGQKTFLDSTAQYGQTYYYTVKAMNDDNLGSDRPEPVTLYTRQGEPFSPVAITRWSDDAGHPRIYWNQPEHPNLTAPKCLELTAGYLVYRSNKADGQYYQVSPLISWETPYFTDMNARVDDENWYRVKVLNTAGFISDFSEPIHATDQSRSLTDSMFTQLTGLGMNPYDAQTLSEAYTTEGMQQSFKQPAGKLEPSATPPLMRTPEPKPTVIPTPTPSVIPLPTPTPSVIPTPTPTVIPLPGTPTPTPGQDTAPPTPGQDTTPTPGQDTATPTPMPYTATPAPTMPPYVPVSPTPLPVSPTPGPGVTYGDTMIINDFVIKNVSPETWVNNQGTGDLMLLDYPVRVSITVQDRRDAVITRGSVSMLENSVLGDTGVYLTALSVNTSQRTGARATGFVKSTDGNMMGDLDKLHFTDSLLTSDGFIEITRAPVFHYQNLTFLAVEKIRVDFGDLSRDGMVMPFITLSSGLAENSLSLEYFNANTVMHRGIQYRFSTVAFNKNGQLNGSFRLDGTQMMRVVVPAGLCIKVTASFLDYRQGQVNPSSSYIEGRILTRYETWTGDQTTGDTWDDAPDHALTWEQIGVITQSGTAPDNDLVTSALYFIAQGAQSNTLLLFPDNIESDEAVSSLPFSITAWDGGGFMVDETVMTPANIPLFDPNKMTQQQQAEQRNAMLGITPGKVALDLRRDQAWNGTAPADAKDPAWMGIVVKSGNISLPPSYVKATDGQRIRFDLSPGQLLYDLNGFCYQNQAYSPEGRAANLGEDLGGFDNLVVRNIVIDLYANNADVLVEGDLGIDLFQRYVRIQMLRDDHTGRFVCNVLESEQFDVAGDGKVKIKLSNGYLDKKGIHLNGYLSFEFSDGTEESFVISDAGFNNLVIPPQPKADSGQILPRDAYDFKTTAILTKPYSVKFHDFPMELRSLELSAKPLPSTAPQPPSSGYQGMRYSADITFFGGMQLADKIAVNTDEDLDRICFTGVFNAPAVSYEGCRSQLDMVFEDFTRVRGVGKPVLPPEGCDTGAFIEYDTSDMEILFCPSNALSFDSAFDVRARFGYDKVRKRYYYAVASYYKGAGIPFGFGEIYSMGGMFAYNMQMQRNQDQTFMIPGEKDALFAAVPLMQPDTSPNGSYAFAASCDMSMRYLGYKFGELNNVYLAVEKGPNVEMGGQFRAATDIDSLITQTGFEPVGEAKIGYYSTNRMFRFSLALLGTNIYGLKVSGEMSFVMCPDYWSLYVGYPDYMTATLGPLYAGLSLGIRDSDIDESFLILKAKAGYDTGDVTITIIYFRGFLEFGGEGGISDSAMWLSAYVRGGISGGVKALGKRFEVISLMLDAGGRLAKYMGRGWNLDAHVSISYHVDLVLDDIDGSVDWHINKDF